MDQTLPPIIPAQDALLLAGKPGVIIIDTRTGDGVKTRYAAEHLEGALFVDLDSELADIKPDAADGGRHPLPEPAQFAAVLGQLGISPESHVLIYDDKNASSAAARFWWMLRSIGHRKVQVIDGGMNAAIAAGFKTSNIVPSPAAVDTLGDASWELPLAGLAEVETASVEGTPTIIDVRSKERYDGDEEPIDLVAGHIPGAINIPFTNNLDEKGNFLSPEKLREIYAPVLNGENAGKAIVHCGSGVTACHTLLALAHAGFEIPRLYVGSWSEWSRNNKPIATTSK